MQLLLSKLSS
ncbi:uncharacterized protein FFFS_13939 [Fusarium fujikuroi]|nr:uncharacterized protein FFFS_13939 [Fusarium fujikuroi]